MKYLIPLLVGASSLVVVSQSTGTPSSNSSVRVKACSTIKPAKLDIDPSQYVKKNNWWSNGTGTTPISSKKNDSAPGLMSGEIYFHKSHYLHKPDSTPAFTITRAPLPKTACDVGSIQFEQAQKTYMQGDQCPDFTFSILRDVEKENYHEWVVLRTCPLRQKTHKPETKLTRFIGGKNELIGMFFTAAYAIKREEMEQIAAEIESIPVIVTDDSATPQTPLPTPSAPKSEPMQ